MENKAVILLSGGIDSSTTLAVARDRSYELYALTIQYGQRHRIEIDAARKIARALQVRRHEVVNIDLSICGGSALTDDIEVPKRMLKDSPDDVIPVIRTADLILSRHSRNWRICQPGRELKDGSSKSKRR